MRRQPARSDAGPVTSGDPQTHQDPRERRPGQASQDRARDLPDPQSTAAPDTSGLGEPVPYLLGQRPGVLRELPELPRHRPAPRIAVSRHRRWEREMKKFLVLTYGFVPPTDEVQQAWAEW